MEGNPNKSSSNIEDAVGDNSSPLQPNYQIAMATPGELIMRKHAGTSMNNVTSELGLPNGASEAEIYEAAQKEEDARKRAVYGLPPEATQEQYEKASRDGVAARTQATLELGHTATPEQVQARAQEIKDGWGPDGNPNDTITSKES